MTIIENNSTMVEKSIAETICDARIAPIATNATAPITAIDARSILKPGNFPMLKTTKLMAAIRVVAKKRAVSEFIRALWCPNAERTVRTLANGGSRRQFLKGLFQAWRTWVILCFYRENARITAPRREHVE